MRFPSNLLQIFRFSGGIQQPEDSDIDVDSRLFPIVSIPKPLLESNAAAIWQESGIAGLSLDRPPSTAGVTNTIVTLAPGLWELMLHYTFSANFAPGNFFITANPNGIPNVLVLVGPSTPPTGFTITGTIGPFRLALQSNLVFQLTVPTTGVAQNATATVSTFASRLG